MTRATLTLLRGPTRLTAARDWVLFAVAALAPALAAGALGVRALASEEAAVRREMSRALAVSAERARADLDRAMETAGERLRAAVVPVEPAGALEAMRGIAPPFAETVVLRADLKLSVPEAARVERPAPPVRCDAIPAELAASASDPARRAALVREAVATCTEARSASGRWTWPLLALEAMDGELDARLAGWLEDHASELGPSEKAALRAEIERGRARLSDGDHRRALAALDGTGAVPRVERSLAARLEDPGVQALVRRGPDARGVIAVRHGSTIGVFVPQPDGRIAGFVAHRASLERAIARRAWPMLDAEQRAELVRGGGGPSAPAGTEIDVLEARAALAPDLAVRLIPADPRALERAASRRRIALVVLTAVATGLMVAVASILFARMRAARRSSQLRVDFVSAVSHELRTPIASLRMLTELLEQNRVEPEERDEVHAAVAREARRLGDTVERLLGFSRMAAGRVVLDSQPAPVAPTVEASIAAFEERHGAGVRVDRDLDQQVQARIDVDQIRLAVDNLLANALKYAPDGGPYVVRVARAGSSVVIEVSDRGPGIARRDHGRIFEPFERADDKLSRATEGSGIGLALVRHVARAHGGEATVDSTPGAGARFTLRLSAIQEQERSQ